ncbi:hypothetical protein SCHPADRAFT_940609 [Schizopora paradoxa]|uniref:DUF6533 domain-containing protein n=1 Tax=Schizopora paradoxa TaxID=27342 RepID=A0A0H2RMF5_9AGAM|nr:hypothetical protein SCHPADRAFT_940609 [Schizopora paradoxa]
MGVIVNGLHKVVIVKYVNLASATLLTYDTIINIEEEVNFIWRNHWNLGTWLYLATRYLAFVDTSTMLFYLFLNNMNVEHCHSVYAASMCGLIAEIILSVRAYALWKRSRLMLISLVVLNVVCIFSKSYRSSEGQPQVDSSDADIIYHTLIDKCVGFPALSVSDFCPMSSIGSYDKGIRFFCQFHAFRNSSDGFGDFKCWRETSNPLIRILYKDGILHLVCLLSSSCVNVVIFSVESMKDYYALAVELQRVFHGILSARIILNLRKVASNSRGWTDFSISKLSNLPEKQLAGRVKDNSTLESIR